MLDTVNNQTNHSNLIGSNRNLQTQNGSPEPPPPPPRNHDASSSFNDSKESNEISEAECDRDNGPRGNYGGKFSQHFDAALCL